MTRKLRFIAAGCICSFAHLAYAEDTDAGRTVFTETSVPTCSVCHSLSDAEAVGEIGPNLDDFKPTFEQVRAAVTSGIGVMPAYGETLTSAEIDTVSKYVSEVTGGGSSDTATTKDPKPKDNDDKS